MKNRFNKMFDSVEVSKELDERILNKTIYKKNSNFFKPKILKFATIILAVCIFFGVGVVAKDYIMDFVFHKNILESEKDDSQIYLELNGKVEINENNNLI